MFGRNRPSDLHPAESTQRISKKVQFKQLSDAMGQVLTCRFFWPVALWFFFDFAIFFSFGGLWSGPYLMHVHGMR